MIGWLGRQEFVNMFGPEDRDLATEQLIPSDGGLELDKVVECWRVFRLGQTGM